MKINEYKFEEIYIGLEESFKKEVTEDMMTNFLSISGDINPLHNDLAYAKESGFSSKVVYGMLTASFYSTLVGVYLPGKFCILQGIDIKFTKPVFVNDKLTITGKVNYINEAFKQLEIKAKITNQNGVTISKATIKAGVINE